MSKTIPASGSTVGQAGIYGYMMFFHKAAKLIPNLSENSHIDAFLIQTLKTWGKDEVWDHVSRENKPEATEENYKLSNA